MVNMPKTKVIRKLNTTKEAEKPKTKGVEKPKTEDVEVIEVNSIEEGKAVLVAFALEKKLAQYQDTEWSVSCATSQSLFYPCMLGGTSMNLP